MQRPSEFFRTVATHALRLCKARSFESYQMRRALLFTIDAELIDAARHAFKEWQILSARDLPQVRRALRKRLDLIVFDADMARLDWRALISWFSTLPQPICVIVLAHDTNRWSEAVALGAYAVIRKPIGAEGLLQVARAGSLDRRSRTNLRRKARAGKERLRL